MINISLKNSLILIIFFINSFYFKIYGQSCNNYTTWTTGMWIGPGSYCGTPYGGTTVTSGGRLYTHKGYCSNTGPGTWDFKDAGACVSCVNPSVPVVLSASAVTCNGFTANWNASTNSPTGYLLDVSTSSSFTSFVSGYNARSVGNVTSFNVTGLTSGVTYYYRVRALKTGCTTSGNSTTITQVTLSTPAQPGNISGTAIQCPSTTNQIYSINAVNGATTYNWSVPVGWTITAGAGTTSITVTTGNAGQNGNISVTAGNSCGTSLARTFAVSVRAAFISGTISSTGQTICYGGTPSIIGSTTLASGGDGAITYSWRSSADGYTSPITGATAATYTPPTGLTTTTSYRRYAKDNTCNTTPVVSSGTWTVTVRSQFSSGTISSNGETICYGGTPSSIGSTTVASGGDGVITYSWRSSSDGYTSPITGATAATFTPPTGLTTTTSYRRYAKDNTCNTTPVVSSGTWTVTVRSQFSSGTISSNGETICYGGTPSSIGSTTLASGGDGAITYSWRSSADGYISPISGATAATYTPPTGLTTTTSYRRYAKDNTCNTTPVVSSGTWTVTVGDVYVSGSISSLGETICNGSTPKLIESLSEPTGGFGTITYSWRSSADDYSSEIIGATAANYTPPAGLTTTTSYRRYEMVNSCSATPTVSSGTWTVTISNIFKSGTISSNGETICYGETPSLIGSTTAASGGDGAITYSWRSSADDYSSEITGATAATYTPPVGLTTTTSYRRYAKDNMCNTTPLVSSGTWTITVNSLPNITVNPSLNNTINLGTSIQLQVSGASSYSWSPSNLFSNPSLSNQTLTPTNNVTLNVVGFSSQGCSANKDIQINVNTNIANNPQYYKLLSKLNNEYVVATNDLNISYLEQYDVENFNTLNYTIYDSKRDVVLSFANQPITIQKGTNLLSIQNIDAVCFPNQFYVLEVVNIKKEKFYLRFQLKN